MSSPCFTAKSWNGRHLSLKHVTPEERAGIIRDAVARKVSQNCESHGCEPGHELKDWRQAESEVLRPLNCGFLVLDHSIELSTDTLCFAEGEIQICVEPRHLMIYGTVAGSAPEIDANPARYSIVRTLELPLEIEPSEASARFKGRTIEIDLPKAYAMQKAAAG
jgi:hypothetical protein